MLVLYQTRQDAELGRFPIEIYIKSRMIRFWSRLVCDNFTKTACILYKLIFHMDNMNMYHSNWLNYSNIWLLQEKHNQNWLKIWFPNKDQFIQTWLSNIWNSNTCTNYSIFKISFSLEPYLTKLNRTKDYISLCKFRSGCSKIPIVTGRYQDIDRENRICTLCNEDIGDEYH